MIYRCKLSEAKQKQLLMLFVSGCTARAAAPIVEVNRATSTLFFRKIRKNIFKSRQGAKKINGIVEIDECYTSSGEGGRKKARRGRNLDGKICLIGAVDREKRKIKIERIRKTDATTINQFINQNVSYKATIHTDSFRAYNGLKENGFKHLKVNHFLTFKDKKTNACTNLIESSWAKLRRHLNRFCGGFRNNLDLWLAEVEHRIENTTQNLFKSTLKIIRNS